MRVLVLGAGGAAANGFCRSLRAAGGYHLIGANSSPVDLLLSETDERYVAGLSFRTLIANAKPDFVHAQPDAEVLRLSENRAILDERGIRYFLPSHDTIVTCQDKWASYQRWRDANVPVPETELVEHPAQVERFMRRHREVWVRRTQGAGGSGSRRTSDPESATRYLHDERAWRNFTVAAALTDRSVTQTAIWKDGRLLVSQQRLRRSWAYGRNTPSGVSGITGAGETCSDPRVDEVADAAVLAVDAKPNGIYSVDLTYDHFGMPNPTEINIGRFFTTIEFFTRAGLNLPHEYVQAGMGDPVVPLLRNPLPDGLLWIRTMDKEPVLVPVGAVDDLDIA